MGLTAEEKTEFKEFITAAVTAVEEKTSLQIKNIEEKTLLQLKNIEEKTTNQFNIIDYKLDAIEKQTTQTNGRLVTAEEKLRKLEKSENEHLLMCPQAERVRKLEDQALSNKVIKGFIVKTVIITSAVMSIILGIFTMINLVL